MKEIIMALVVLILSITAIIGFPMILNEEKCGAYYYFEEHQTETNVSIDYYRPNTINICPPKFIYGKERLKETACIWSGNCS